jgi:transcriptional regulator with XRE-family HTH domain
MTHRSLALQLRVLRAERALTIEQAAARAGVTPETISDAERGRRHPYLPTLRKLAAGYGVPVEELLASEAEESEAALAGMGKAEAPAAGPTPPGPAGLPEWASTSDIDALSRNIETLSSEELREAILQLSANLAVNRTYESARAETREETRARVLNFAEIDLIAEELRRRGGDPPENWLPAYRRWKHAMTPPPEAATDSAEDSGAAEAG